jgi:succinate dehydrogenase hydrophobic anchor subunit
MPAAAWMTIAVSGLIIVFIAVGLIRIVLHLMAIRTTLRAVTGGVQAVDQLTSTVPARLTSVNANLKPVRDFCETV